MSAQLIFLNAVLCQDCLCAREFTAARHDGDELCECGGDFCGCGSCQNLYRKLIKGQRKASELGTNTDIWRWSSERGARL